MKINIKRSHATELSDDELILFDVLFDSYTSVNSLKKEDEFSLRFNYKSHAMNANELKDTIERFVANGLMRFKLCVHGRNNEIVTYVGLTEKGGKLWEMERLPIWDKFVTDSSYDYNGFCELAIISPNLQVAKDFIKIAQECKLYELSDPIDLEIEELQKEETKEIIPWKTFDKLYKITSRLSDRTGRESPQDTNWVLYETKLMWWRTVDELQMLKHKNQCNVLK